MRAILPKEITTERLLLRQYDFGDLDDVFKYASDEEWQQYLPLPHPYERQHAIEFLARTILLDWTQHPSWAIVESGKSVGGVNIRFDFERRMAGMGWAIARPLWGRGLTSEAVGAVVDLAFETHPDLNRIEAYADARNIASQRVMEKVGMSKEGILRQHFLVRDELRDDARYAILRSEWENR